MDDFSFWWYIIAAVIYFLTSRGKKKKKQAKPGRPGTESAPPRTQQPKSFEELLREITEGRQPEVEVEPVQSDEVVIEKRPQREPVREDIRLEGERRAFADEESKRVYEESIKMAEGAELKFETNEKFGGSSLLKGKEVAPEKASFAKEIMSGFDLDEAKKAVVYAEIFKRKY